MIRGSKLAPQRTDAAVAIAGIGIDSIQDQAPDLLKK
jgi:hypothetical protein